MSATWKEWEIPARKEYRFEVAFEVTFVFKLTSGSAEVFGSELAVGREYSVSGCKLAVFSWTGAKIAVQGGPCLVEYLSSDDGVAQQALLNLQVALERARTVSTSTAPDASTSTSAATSPTSSSTATASTPRVLVIGPGRNTVARTLMNYAARRLNDSGSERPILVDLDVSNGSLLFPGTMGAIALDRPVEVEESWHSIPQNQLISFFYGSAMIADNPKIYGKLASRLGAIVESRISHGRASMVYMIAPSELGLESASSKDLLLDLIRCFAVDTIVVVGNERLFVTISKVVSVSDAVTSPRVLKLPKSEGVVGKDAAFRRSQQSSQFHAYFYGPRQEFHPFSLTLSAGSVEIFRVAEMATLAPSSALPLGATRKIDSTKLMKVTDLSPSALLYSILGVVRVTEPGIVSSAGTATATKPFYEYSVAGYLHVMEVDESKQTLTVLSPSPGPLPSKILLLSSLKWIEK